MIIHSREDHERSEMTLLAPYARKSGQNRGREVSESLDPLRTEFQRDRDRIIHCSAFRKLEYKTQVYVTHEGDHFRTRLTHTLEVAQIARTIARSLGLNPDLTEAIALAHDLGHTPFGHTGEAVLDELLADGFEHNAQSLRIVEMLEARFEDRPGLNLTWDVREGLAHHSKATTPDVKRYQERNKHPSLEAQLVDIADEIAYNHHDIDDAIQMKLLKLEQLEDLPWLWEFWKEVQDRHLRSDQEGRYAGYRALGKMMDSVVEDVVHHSAAQLTTLDLGRSDASEQVLHLEQTLIGFSSRMREKQTQLRQLLLKNVYHHPITLRMQVRSRRFLKELFGLYYHQSSLLPWPLQERIKAYGHERVIADYLSGMTDRHCLEDYIGHFEPTLRWAQL